MGKWAKIGWLLGTVGVLGAWAHHALVPHAAVAPVVRGTAHRPNKTAQSSPVLPAGSIASTAPVVASTTTRTTLPLAAFGGHGVAETGLGGASNILPRDYPLASNPIEFYTPGSFKVAQTFSGILKSSSFTVQIDEGTADPVVAVSVATNGTPIAAQLFTNPIAIAAFSQDSVVIKSIMVGQSPLWYRINLITGHIGESNVPPTGWSSTNPNIEGIHTVMAQTVFSPANPPASSLSSATSSSLPALLAQEINAMLLTHMGANSIVVSQTDAHDLTVNALNPTRWTSINFTQRQGTWVPTQIQTRVAQMTLTYDVTADSAVLPHTR